MRSVKEEGVGGGGGGGGGAAESGRIDGGKGGRRRRRYGVRGVSRQENKEELEIG